MVLLIGETRVGKTSILKLIASVLVANESDDYDFGIIDHAQSETSSARLYEFASKNGVVVCVGAFERGGQA